MYGDLLLPHKTAEKPEFDKYAASGVNAFSIRSIYVIQISKTKIVITVVTSGQLG